MKVVVVGGPGFAKTRFFDKIKVISDHEKDKKFSDII